MRGSGQKYNATQLAALSLALLFLGITDPARAFAQLPAAAAGADNLAGGGPPPQGPPDQQGPPPQQGQPPQTSSPPRSDEEDFSETPFTRYGEFNEAEDEEADDKFFQFGRFFGVSFGVGSQFADGNRGSLWQGGFPVFDFKLHYWFDFNIALDVGFRTAQQYFDTVAPTSAPLGHVDVNLVMVGVDLKYYLPVQDLSAVISFAGPYLIAGVGGYTKTQNSNQQANQDSDSSLGVSFGAGMEFTLSPRRSYFELEFKANIVTFKDTYTTIYQSVGLTNMTGNFYTATASVLFTW